jgi:hypothetical protein
MSIADPRSAAEHKIRHGSAIPGHGREPNDDALFFLRFEREGGELEYQVEEKGYAQFLCKIELPVDTPTGESSVVEALVKGKK